MKKIGLYFGSFNPIHNGHLTIARYFKSVTDLQEIWLVVSPQNPLKDPALLAPQNHRLAMVKIALADSPHILASDIEFALPKPSFTIQTLDVLSKKHSQCSFVVIMGEDSLANIDKWKEYKRLLSEFDFYVFHRKESNPIPAQLTLSRVTFFSDAPAIPISSTAIRAAILRGEQVGQLVPKGVTDYISAHRLYQGS